MFAGEFGNSLECVITRDRRDGGWPVNISEFIFPVIPSYIFDGLSEGAGGAAGIMQKYSRVVHAVDLAIMGPSNTSLHRRVRDSERLATLNNVPRSVSN